MRGPGPFPSPAPGPPRPPGRGAGEEPATLPDREREEHGLLESKWGKQPWRGPLPPSEAAFPQTVVQPLATGHLVWLPLLWNGILVSE